MTNYSQTISNGVVSIEDGLKAAEDWTPARKVRVELHFDTNEADPQAILDAVCLIAENKVRTLLGRPTLGQLGDSTAIPATATTEKPKATRTKKAEPAPAPATNISDADELDLGSVSEESTSTSDDLGLEDVDDVNLDDLLGVETAPPAKVISDAELGSAAMARNEATKNAVAIRKLVAAFTEGNAPTNRNARDIPQEKRQAFLDALKEIKAA